MTRWCCARKSGTCSERGGGAALSGQPAHAVAVSVAHWALGTKRGGSGLWDGSVHIQERGNKPGLLMSFFGGSSFKVKASSKTKLSAYVAARCCPWP